MGLLDRFKKKEDDFDNLPFLPNEPSLPPLPPQKGRQMGPNLPPRGHLPPRNLSGPGNLPDLPPIPKIPIEESRDLPPMPKQIKPMMLDEELSPLSEPELDEPLPPIERNIPTLTEPTMTHEIDPMESAMSMPKKKAKVFVQLSKYKDIVNTVNKMEGRINELQSSINKIKDIREKESQLIEAWNGLLSEAKLKMDDVTKKLPVVDDY
jgi:hypothetical protein